MLSRYNKNSFQLAQHEQKFSMEKNELKGEENKGKKESYARDKNHKLVGPERRKVEAVTTEFK